MPEARNLRELHDLALRLAMASNDADTREMLLTIAEEYLAQAEALEAPTIEPDDEPPLPAS